MNFPANIHRHAMNGGPLTTQPSDGSKPYTFDDIRIGHGHMILGMITGIDFAPGDDRSPAYASPTIAEANAIADELIRRWNAHEALWAHIVTLETARTDALRAIERQIVADGGAGQAILNATRILGKTLSAIPRP